MTMKCWSCRHDFPKGGRFCPNCGLEPMGRSNLTIGLLFISLNILLGAHWLNKAANHENGLVIVIPGLVLIVAAGYAVYLFLWFQWTRPIDADTVANCVS